MAEIDQTEITLVPAPTGGWNARDPLHAMPENQAIELVNYFPEGSDVQIRGGSSLYWTSPWSTSPAFVKGTWAQPGTADYLILLEKTGSGGSDALHLYRILVSDGTTTEIADASDGLENETYLTTIFRGYLFGFSEGGYSFSVDPSGAYADTPFTATPINGVGYKGHMFLVPLNSATVEYGALTAISGAVTSYDVSPFLSRGGNVLAVGTTTQMQGDLAQELFVLISTVGEILVFQGSNPASATWSLVARFFVGQPLGRGCFVYRGSDLHVNTSAGIFSVQGLFRGANADGLYESVADNIRLAVSDAADTFLTSYTAGESWGAVYAPSHKMWIFTGVQPLASTQYQYVQNIITNAWCSFSGIDSNKWVGIGRRVFWGNARSVAATYATLQELGLPNSSGNIDGTTPFTASCRQAFNYLGNPSITKHITSVKAFFEITQETGHSTATREVKLGADSDFKDEDITSNIKLKSITPDATTSYITPVDVRAEGTTFSLIFKSRFGGGYKHKWNLFIVNSEPGGYFG